MIITARGHEPTSIKNTVKWIIDNYLNNIQKNKMLLNLERFNKLFNIDINNLSDNDIINNYLNICDFIGISSQYFIKNFNNNSNSVKPEDGKALAIKYFVNKINEYGKILNVNISVGFSDDDLKTINHIYSYIQNKLSFEYPIKYKVYHTQNGIKEITF